MLHRKLFQSQPSTSSSQPPHHHRHHHHILIPLLAATTVVLTLLLLFTFLHRRRKKHTTPLTFTDDPPHRFTYSHLRRATNSFSTPLGHGGFGTVFSGTLSSIPIAVKLMDTDSEIVPQKINRSLGRIPSFYKNKNKKKLIDTSFHQGEREFHNELFFASKLRSLYTIPPLGFSSDPKRRRFLLVYPLMQNGNLQDALLKRKCVQLLNWKKRFEIVMDIAKGLCYLHCFDPPVIHGDVKPSNVLLDCDFNAKIGDFGLARLKSELVRVEIEVLGVDSDDEVKKGNGNDELEVVVDDCGSIESGHTGFFEEGGHLGTPVASPESVEMRMNMAMAMAASPGFDKVSEKSEKGKGLTSNSVRDWWWKQDNEVAV